MNRLSIAFATIIGAFALATGAGGTASAKDAPQGLAFPVANVADLQSFYCFGLFPWDAAGIEVHDGIDLVADYDPTATALRRVPLVAAADAHVERIVESTTGAGVANIVVVLRMNKYWYLAYSIEPQTADEDTFEAQRRSVAVREKQHVKRGEPIGELVVGNVVAGHYPHVHFSLFYKHPDDTLDDLFENFLDVRRSDGTDLAPAGGPGSPWKPRELGIETTFYCPYEYSTAEAKAAYDSLPRNAANGDVCRCICAYGSAGGDCGDCGPAP